MDLHGRRGKEHNCRRGSEGISSFWIQWSCLFWGNHRLSGHIHTTGYFMVASVLDSALFCTAQSWDAPKKYRTPLNFQVWQVWQKDRKAQYSIYISFRIRRQSLAQKFFWNKIFILNSLMWALLTSHRYLHSLSRYLHVRGERKACFVD